MPIKVLPKGFTCGMKTKNNNGLKINIMQLCMALYRTFVEEKTRSNQSHTIIFSIMFSNLFIPQKLNRKEVIAVL